jgi:choline dehydrogenase-like flavoprotein
MIIDAKSVPAGTVLDSDVCIVGAGAAGIALAREFIGTSFRIVLLESGGMRYEADTQALYKGHFAGQAFKDLLASRLRFFGGTTNHWGGWCLPLDAVDFETREDRPYSGWPFPRSHLDPWYRRAQDVCRLGPFDYRPATWGIEPDTIPPPFNGPSFECKVLQVSSVFFRPVYEPDLSSSSQITVYLHANAFHLDAGESGAAVRQLTVKTLADNDFKVRARMFVLATGGIENARLLLASGPRNGNGLGNTHDLVGRFFMVHFAYPAGVIVPADPRQTFDFRRESYYRIGDKKYHFWSFVGPSADCIRKHGFGNMVINWRYKFSPEVEGVDALKRIVEGDAENDVGAELSKVLRHFEGVAEYAARKVLFGEEIPIDALEVRFSAEQAPNPQNRITLGQQRDRLGMPEVVVDWRLTADDKRWVVSALQLLGAEIGRTGFGRFRPLLTEESSWPDDAYYGDHHLGSTRMHPDPQQGVVDANCRVHGVENLFVAGSSVFPTGSANNPTLTIIALALRLADHIKEQLA